MNILIYGNGYDQNSLEELIGSCGAMQYRRIHFFKPDSYNEYIAEMKRVIPQIIFVSEHGAEGMEAVIAAKNLHPNTSVIWFSNDEGFGTQSYRLGCTYFSAKPVTHEVIEHAMSRYSEERSVRVC
ncbi:MAG: response regulator [Roseburia sp.]|nr:response regulator [Roseburia sp.]